MKFSKFTSCALAVVIASGVFNYSEAEPVKIYVGTAAGDIPAPVDASTGALLTGNADLSCGNNTIALTAGACSNGLFTSGTITNPTTNQVLIGPIDTSGAQSFEFQLVVTSGSGANISVQESESVNGPWNTVSIQATTNTTSLATYTGITGASISGPIRGRYIQLISSNSVEVFTVFGYLRSSPFIPTLSTPAIYGSAALQLNGASANGGNSPLTQTSTKYLVEVPYSIPETTWQWSATSLTTSGTVTIQAAQATGVRNYLRSLQCTNEGTTGTGVTILDGASVIWPGYLAANNGTINISFEPPLRGSTATGMNFNIASSPTGTIVCGGQGYQAY